MNAALSPELLAAEFGARMRRFEPMSRHTSWHAGGPADVFFEPRDAADLSAFLASLPHEIPVLWLGLGSNLLVRDGGVRGVVVSLHAALQEITRVGECEIRAEAGVHCARIAKQCHKWGLGPAEFFAGIPGTLGGALAMNAGAFGGETWNHVIQVEVMNRAGERSMRARDGYQIGYRSVRGPQQDECFIAARLRFGQHPGASEYAIRDLLARRRQTQPIGEWSCGSVFTNPPGDHAARLIEEAGLKGHCIGDACVSQKHANFILNRGAARAADIEALIHHVQATVNSRFGILLQPEVRVAGEVE